MSHEVLPGVAVTAEWFRSTFKRLIERNNVALSLSDYAPATIYNPVTGGTVTAYNLAASKASASDLLDSNDPDLRHQYDGIEINVSARLPHGARVFGGSSTERTLSNSCSAAKNNPNLLAFCDQWQNNIPFQTSFKLAGTYPLPWYGIAVSASLQALAGASASSDPLPYGQFTASTGWDPSGNAAGPNGRGTYLNVQQSTTWTATTCLDASKCTVGQRVIPGLTQAGLTVPLVAPSTEYLPRLNQVDFAVNKSFSVGQMRFSPKLDVFNAFNSDAYTGISSTQFGAATYFRPSTILQGRIIRLGVDVKW